MPKPLALQRAEHALAAIENLSGTAKAQVGNYLKYVKGLPANIMRSGLGQAMAMEKAGVNDIGHAYLHRHVQAWLLKGWSGTPYSPAASAYTDAADPKKDPPALLKAIVSGNQNQYVRAQAEALAYLEWLKKFAVAFLDDDAVTPAAPATEENAS